MKFVAADKQGFAKHYALYRALSDPIWIPKDIDGMLKVYEEFQNGFFLVDHENITGGAIVEKNWCGLPFLMPAMVDRQAFFDALFSEVCRKSDLSKPVYFYGMPSESLPFLTKKGCRYDDSEMNMMAVLKPFERTSKQGVRLRTIDKADYETLVKLYTETYRASPLDSIRRKDEPFYEKLLHEQLQNYQKEYSFIATDEKRTPIAAALVSLWQGYPFLLDIVVHPKVQNRGLGSLMLENIMDEAAKKYDYIRLNVTHDNPAKNLYERYGFQPMKPTFTYVLDPQKEKPF